MINKVRKLQEFNISLSFIERESNLGNGTLARVLETGKYRQTTERKFNEFYFRIIKGLVTKL